MNKLFLSNEAVLIAVRDFLKLIKLIKILGVKLVLTNIILETISQYGHVASNTSSNHFYITNKGINL